MSTKQNLNAMSKSELRAYVLQHRDDLEALQTYLDKVQTENTSRSRVHSIDENVSEALDRYLENQPDRK
jgi:phosphoketolase